MKKKLCFVLCLILSGCAHFDSDIPTSQNYQQVMNSWLGRPKEELITAWGVPTHDYWRQNKNYVIYIKSRIVNVADGNKIERMPISAQDYSFFKEETAAVSKTCMTIFTLMNNQVQAWRFDGNDCLAY